MSDEKPKRWEWAASSEGLTLVDQNGRWLLSVAHGAAFHLTGPELRAMALVPDLLALVRRAEELMRPMGEWVTDEWRESAAELLARIERGT